MSATIAALLTLTSGSSPRLQRADQMWGVTIDSVENARTLAESLRRLPARMTARVVFDPGTTPSDYEPALREIKSVANIMGSPVDSAPPSGRMSVQEYRQRYSSFMDALGDSVQLWEVGNEVNGDWTGDSEAMGRKIGAAYDEARKRRKATSLCLFYSDYYRGTDREMSVWAKKYLSDEVRRGVDFVLVSFYPDSPDGKHPDWSSEFKKLGEAFPQAKLGFGELGLRNQDFTLSNDQDKKAALIRRYYGMAAPIPERFVGGYFWWTFRQDAPDSRVMKALQQSVGR